jgi:hypothetical protein
MHVHALVIQSHNDNVLRLSRQFAGTWAEFIELVGKHEAGPKNGRAIVPYRADWSNGEDAQPRKAAHELPGARWSILTLDLDECTDEQLEDAHAQLNREGLSYVLHSTHSYDPAERMKARLHVPLEAEITQLEVPSARVRLAHWLGLQTDKATRGGHTLFYTPRCPEEFVDAAFCFSKVGRPVRLGELPAAPADAPSVKQFKTVSAAVKARELWPQQVRERAEETLDWLCRTIASHASQHLRTELLHPLAPIVGGYAGSGLLDRDTCLEKLETAIDERAERYSYDDHTADERIEEMNKLFEHGYGRPLVPHGYDPNTGELDVEADRTKLRGKDYVNAKLADHAPDRLYTADEAAEEMYEFLRRPRYAVAPWLGLVEVSVGVGKTYALRQLAAERAAVGEYTIILSLDHALLGQIRRDLEAAGTPARQLHSVMQPTSKTGGPECQRMHDVDIKLLVRSGANVLASACGKCPFRSDCAALKHKRRTLQEHVVLAPYDMADFALDMVNERKDSPGAPLLVCDEEPPGPATVMVKLEELEEARDSGAWSLLREDQASAGMGLVHSLLDDSDPPVELVEAVAGYYGQLHMTGWSVNEERQYRHQLDTIRRVLTMALGWQSRVLVKDLWRAQVPQRAWRALRAEGGFVLSATPNHALYDELGIAIEHKALRVRDHSTSMRYMVYSTHANRRNVMPGGEIDWKLVDTDLKQMFRIIPKDHTVLLGTYKAISDALKTDKAVLLRGRDVAITHYEVVRGRDDWKDRDAFVSMYDPLPPPPMTVVVKEDGRKILIPDWNAAREQAARTVEQFHGRARDPQPRERPALHYHFGSVPPVGWWKKKDDGNTEVRWREQGSEPTPLPDDVCEALKELYGQLGSYTAAAKVANVPTKTFRRWLKGESGPRGERLVELCRVLGLDESGR